jgi:hypothetical protein
MVMGMIPLVAGEIKFLVALLSFDDGIILTYVEARLVPTVLSNETSLA